MNTKPELLPKVGGEERVDEGVGGRVQGRQVLDDDPNGVSSGRLAPEVQQSISPIGSPRHRESCKKLHQLAS